MTKLSITVPSDSAIASYLSQQPTVYLYFGESNGSEDFSYEGVLPPLAKISQLLAVFTPSEYTISKSTTGFSFIVWSL